jgi:hypothetical protein
MYICAVVALAVVSQHSAQGRSTIEKNTLGEWPIVISVLKILQKDHPNKKKQFKESNATDWWMQELTTTKLHVRLSIDKTGVENADGHKPKVLKLFNGLHDHMYGIASTCTMNRPYGSFNGRSFTVPKDFFSKGSPVARVGPNNCFVASFFLTEEGRDILARRARHVDADALMEQEELLLWMQSNKSRLQAPDSDEAPDSDVEVVGPPKKKKSLPQAPPSDNEVVDSPKTKKKRRQARSSNDEMADSPNEIHRPKTFDDAYVRLLKRNTGPVDIKLVQERAVAHNDEYENKYGDLVGFRRASGCYLGRNNCRVAKDFLTPAAKACLRARARHVDAPILISMNQILPWQIEKRALDSDDEAADALDAVVRHPSQFADELEKLLKRCDTKVDLSSAKKKIKAHNKGLHSADPVHFVRCEQPRQPSQLLPADPVPLARCEQPRQPSQPPPADPVPLARCEQPGQPRKPLPAVPVQLARFEQPKPSKTFDELHREFGFGNEAALPAFAASSTSMLGLDCRITDLKKSSRKRGTSRNSPERDANCARVEGSVRHVFRKQCKALFVVCVGDPSAAVFELETASLAGAAFPQMTLRHLHGLNEGGLLYDQPGTLQGVVALDRTVRANLIARRLVGTGNSNCGGSSVAAHPPVVSVAHLCTTAEEALNTFSDQTEEVPLDGETGGASNTVHPRCRAWLAALSTQLQTHVDLDRGADLTLDLKSFENLIIVVESIKAALGRALVQAKRDESRMISRKERRRQNINQGAREMAADMTDGILRVARERLESIRSFAGDGWMNC